MRRIRTRYRLAVVIFALFCGVIWLSIFLTAPTPVELVAILPMTGGGVSHTEVANAMQIAVSHINDGGGLNGRPLELRILDSEGSPQRARALFAESEKTSRPLAYISTLSSVSNALAPDAQAAQVPLLTTVATDESLIEGRDWVFSFYYTSEMEAACFDRILQRLDARNPVLLYQEELYGQADAAALSRLLKAREQPLKLIPFPLNLTQFDTLAQQVKGYDAVVLVAYKDRIAKIAKAIGESGYTGALLLNHPASMPDIVRLPVVDRAYIAAPLFYAPDNRFPQQLRTEYQERFGAPMPHHAAFGFESVRLITDLMRGHQLKRITLRERLRGGFTFPCAFGVIESSTGNRSFSIELYPAQVQRNRCVYLRGMQETR